MKKIEFDLFYQSMSPFLIFQDVEDKMVSLLQERINFVNSFKLHQSDKPNFELLMDFLKDGDVESKLRLLLGITGSSLEKFKRVYAVFVSGGLNKMKNDEELRKRVVNLFLFPENEQFVPQFILLGFKLPADWTHLVNDESYISRIMHDDLNSQYSVDIGFKLESEIGNIITSLGLGWEKGEVPQVGRKEVDLAIPNCNSPKFLIMSSYSLTTSNAQTQRANEQMGMYHELGRFNRSRMQENIPDIKFVNVLDGGGWIARKKDLFRLWGSCDYCFSYRTLEDLKILLQNQN